LNAAAAPAAACVWHLNAAAAPPAVCAWLLNAAAPAAPAPALATVPAPAPASAATTVSAAHQPLLNSFCFLGYDVLQGNVAN
jgi:hypothetical protein